MNRQDDGLGACFGIAVAILGGLVIWAVFIAIVGFIFAWRHV